LGSFQPFPIGTVRDLAEAPLPLSAMVRFPQSFKHILGADATFAAWEARRGREEELTGIVRRLLPRQLALRINVADARNGQLELVADAGAVAAIVRQRSAELLSSLKRQGWEFTGIRVRVQVRTDAGPARKPVANPLDRSSLQPMAALARDLPHGPLRVALERFLRRAG
jgi:hypothetical protein